MLRGTTDGLEFVFAGRPFDDAWAEIAERLAQSPGFYRGSEATAIFDGQAPEDGAVARFLTTVGDHGIAVRGVYGGEAAAALAQRFALAYLGEARPTVANFERERAAREVRLTDSARSLAADFAGARADIATRRARGEASVPKPVFGFTRETRSVEHRAAPPAHAPSTLYHRGTLRGGQSLQQLGTIVIMGDVNPGAEVVATGDIVVFGTLRGTAHAGAQGDANARVFALELTPTQLRIANYIAAGDPLRKPREPDVAFVEGERIAIAPYATLGATL